MKHDRQRRVDTALATLGIAGAVMLAVGLIWNLAAVAAVSVGVLLAVAVAVAMIYGP